MSKNHKTEEIGLISQKQWKIKLERVQKGYVRATVHGDTIWDALNDWRDLHDDLNRMGEKVEAVIESENEAKVSDLAKQLNDSITEVKKNNKK